MKRILTTLLFVCITALTYAQNTKVTLTVIDATTQEGIAGAVVGIAPAADPDNEELTRYGSSGYNGATTILGIKRGEYKVKISFLGYAEKIVDLKANAATVDLGKIALEEEATKIETVVKTVQAIRASQKGDTIAYNADAFKVANDADVEGLLKKMPGITVSNGSVEAQGGHIHGLQLVGGVIIKVHHLNMTTKTSHFALNLLLKADYHTNGHNHDHHPNHNATQSHTHSRTRATCLTLIREIQSLCYFPFRFKIHNSYLWFGIIFVRTFTYEKAVLYTSIHLCHLPPVGTELPSSYCRGHCEQTNRNVGSRVKHP